VRILFVVSFYSRLRRVASGGMERCLWSLRTSLGKRHKVLVVCRTAESRTTGVHTLGPTAGESNGLTVQEMIDRYIDQVLRLERHHDLIIAYNFPELLPALSKRCICIFFNHCEEWLPRGTGNNKHIFVFPARWVRDAFWKETKQPLEGCRWQPMGVDTNRFRPSSKPRSRDKPLTLLFSSVWHVGKGLEIFLAACQHLHNSRVPFNAILAGSPNLWDFGDQQETIYPTADQAQIIETVMSYRKSIPQLNVVGEIPHNQMPRLLNEVDLVVAPSLWRECLPLTIIEGMAAGTPAIASKRGGAVELVDDRINGYLLDSPDPASITSIVEELARTGGVNIEMTNSARQSVLSLDWDTVAAQFETVFP
jgi:glycosyltransferase involved in cell wall biosynthesis